MKRALVAGTLLIAACGTPKEGDRCDPGTAALCDTTQSLLTCVAGRWVHTPCTGPKGCVNAQCDEFTVGASCTTAGALGCENSTTAVECRSGVWWGIPCRGPGGCEADGGTVRCDESGDMAGDGCGSALEGMALCGPGGGDVLGCRSGVFVETNICSACTIANGVVTCTP